MAKYYRFNPKGEVIVEKTFDDVYTFGIGNEYVLVKKGKKLGVALFESLELVIPVRYDRIESWVNSNPNLIIAWDGENESLIDIKKNLIISNEYSNIYLKNSSDKYAVVTLANKKGIIDEEGNVIIEPKYNNCEILSDDRIVVTDQTDIYLTDNNGIEISERINGERVVVKKYKENDIWVDKYFLLINKDKSGVLDKDFNIILECKYDDYIDFTNNETFFAVLNGANFVFNNKKSIIKQFDFTFKFGSEELLKNGKYNYIVRKDKAYGAKCGILNDNYELVLPIEYDWIDFSNDVWTVRKGRSEYILDEKYNIIPKSKYKQIGKFEEEGIACVQGEDFKYTFINKSGEVIINKKFDSVQLGRRSLLNFLFSNINSEYKSGLCGVCLNSKWGYVDTNGQLVIECKYDEITEFDFENKAIVKFNGYWGIINQEGKTVIDFKYEIIRRYESKNNIIAKFNGNWGIINQLDKIVIDFKYDKIIDYNLDYNTIICKNDDFMGMINLDKNELIPYCLTDLYYNNDGSLFGYSKKTLPKKLAIQKSIEPIKLLDLKFLEKHNNLIHDDLIRIFVLALVSGKEDNLSNHLYIVDIVNKDAKTATFISGYSGGGTWDEQTFLNNELFNGEKGGFTVFDFIRDDESIRNLVAEHICHVDEELDEYQYKSLKNFKNVGNEDLKLLYSVWYNDAIDYTAIAKNDKKRLSKLLKLTGGIKYSNWNFQF